MRLQTFFHLVQQGIEVVPVAIGMGAEGLGTAVQAKFSQMTPTRWFDQFIGALITILLSGFIAWVTGFSHVLTDIVEMQGHVREVQEAEKVEKEAYFAVLRAIADSNAASAERAHKAELNLERVRAEHEMMLQKLGIKPLP